MTELTQALAFSSLIGGTLEYAILMRHREERRREDRYVLQAEAAGQEAMFRAHLLDRGRAGRRWSTAGTRFR